MDDSNYIYSIGHGGRKIEDLIHLLQKYEIKYVVDVRSKPRSRFYPNYNMSALRNTLSSQGIGYLFLGENLGGLPKDPTCYDSSGHVVYDLVKDKEFYQKGISRLVSASNKKIKIACMCSEINPCECHRSKLIGATLAQSNIEIQHINKDGGIETQNSVMRDIINLNNNQDLFSSKSGSLRSRKSYR
jgi:uncharacterized protein (DUF488 family)